VIVKQAFNADAIRRLAHEAGMLERLVHIDGVPRIAEPQAAPDTLVIFTLRPWRPPSSTSIYRRLPAKPRAISSVTRSPVPWLICRPSTPGARVGRPMRAPICIP
jgi:hypothetical protein